MFNYFLKAIRQIRDFLLRFLANLTQEKPEFVPLNRVAQNPIISPNNHNSWEAEQTFNPATVLINGKVYFLYRAIGPQGISSLGYADSNDGFSISKRSPYPVYRHIESEGRFNIYSFVSGGGWGGAEDPRLVKISGEDKLYMTYATFNKGIRITLTSIDKDDFLNGRWWQWKKPVPISPPGEVHKNWVIFPEKIQGKYAILHSINPEIQIAYLNNLNFDGTSFIKSNFGGAKRKNSWDTWIRGAGAPPIKTSHGWLLFYHAMSEGEDNYKVGAMLLDSHNPTKIICRAKAPILAPEKEYENYSRKAGVVYASGAIVKNENIVVYYGGGDSCICVAHAPLNEFLNSLKKGSKPRLKKRRLRIKDLLHAGRT